MFAEIAVAARLCAFPGVIALVAATGHRIGSVARRVRQSRKHDPSARKSARM
jgi:hypothetical protein